MFSFFLFHLFNIVVKKKTLLKEEQAWIVLIVCMFINVYCAYWVWLNSTRGLITLYSSPYNWNHLWNVIMITTHDTYTHTCLAWLGLRRDIFLINDYLRIKRIFCNCISFSIFHQFFDWWIEVVYQLDVKSPIVWDHTIRLLSFLPVFWLCDFRLLKNYLSSLFQRSFFTVLELQLILDLKIYQRIIA